MVGVTCIVVVAVFSVLCLVLGLLGIFAFPSLYKSLIYSNIVLIQHYDETLGFTAGGFAKPPGLNQMNFYFFNITNADEMVYEGARPRVVEVGPYTFMETEEKKYLKFSDDGDQVFYENYKKFIYHDDLSCSTCDYEDVVTIANAPSVGVATGIYDPQFHISPVAKTIISWGLLLMGEMPIGSFPMGDLLFDGYNEPLLSAANSDIVWTISNIWNGGESIIPMPVPDMQTFAYFNGYNNSRDEHYWVHTGKKDVTRLGDIVTWNDQTLLPEEWWTTKEARMINGSDTGTFGKVGYLGTETLPMFHSYLCRSFNAVNQGEQDVAGVPCNQFVVMEDEWDTTQIKNKGFAYRNGENVNYYLDWPSCPNWNSSNCIAHADDPVDCVTDICNDCCNKGHVGDTYVMPPGLYPMACYPGRYKSSPFAILFSAPHFVYSPQVVADSVVGIHPDPAIHRPMIFYYEKMSGLAAQVEYRVQINIPFFANLYVPQNMHLPNTIMPILYQSAHIALTDASYELYRLGFVFLPAFAFWLGIGLVVLAVLLAIIVYFIVTKRRRDIAVAIE